MLLRKLVKLLMYGSIKYSYSNNCEKEVERKGNGSKKNINVVWKENRMTKWNEKKRKENWKLRKSRVF